MDDDDIQESGVLGDDGAQKSTTTTTPATQATGGTGGTGASEVPPPKPPRPMTEQQKNELILKEAFPGVDAPVIKAVLSASGGHIDRAFNALLEMTDPDAVQHEQEQEQPPPRPPRPSVPQSQLEADEQYARQLADHYRSVGEYEARTSNRDPGLRLPRPRPETGLKPNEMYDREHSFIDDDLPIIKENLRKGFQETQTKVNTWFTNLKKRLDEQFDDDHNGHNQGESAFMGRPTRDPSRRSADYDRYDADPELLSDDFAGMKFNSDGSEYMEPMSSGSCPFERAGADQLIAPIQPRQPYANPNRFQPPPPSKSPKSSDGRKVAFSDTVDNIDAYEASPRIPPKDSPVGTAKTSKWQPLSTVEPSPVADNDPFSLGDSEDEKDAKEKTGSKEIKMDDNERLKKAAAEAMADSLVDDKPKTEGAGEKE